MNRIKQGCAAALFLYCGGVSASGYLAAGAGWTSTDFSDGVSENTMEDVNWRISGGYGLGPQWDFEAGYMTLLSGETSNSDIDAPIDAEFYYVGLLGKAGNQTGELFYRVGAGQANIVGASYYASEVTCAESTVIEAAVGTYCDVDESSLAVIIGLGFDYFFTDHLAIRFEGDYLFGEDDLKVTTATIGIKVFF